MLRHLILLVLASLAACATDAPRRSWDDIDLGRRGPVTRRVEAVQLPVLDPAGLQPQLPPGDRPPRPAVYGAPAGGRRIADFEGPAAALSARQVAIPPALWLSALPSEVADAFRSGRLEQRLALDGAAQADVDGDGVEEQLVLVRPTALFEREVSHRYALLLALAPVPGGTRLVSFARFEPLRHGVPARWCHGEWRLAGLVRRHGRSLPVVFEDRGVRCAQLVGGGFDRRLHLVEMGQGASTTRTVEVGSARLGAAGAADVYDGAAWAADVDGDGAEELVVRGIRAAVRPCGQPEGAWWEEELAARVLSPAGVRAFRDGRAMPLADAELPPPLIVRHPAACGAAASR